jgi:hypothetical protein
MQYTVTYLANGANGAPPPAQIVDPGTVITLPGAGAMTNTGKTFGGWNTQANGGGTNYAVGTAFTVMNNVTLYARWQSEFQYTVTYHANGASGMPPSTQTVDPGTIVTLQGAGTMTMSGKRFDGWNTQPEGGGSSYAEGMAYTVNANTMFYAQWGDYVVGGKGPAGGLIFYDKGNDSGGWRYMEAAPSDIDRKLYATEEAIGIETDRAMGTGKLNTDAIMVEANNRGGGFGWAAQACDALVVNGFNDWFLPSRDELHYMYGNLHMKNLGGFSLDWYWSSTYAGYYSDFTYRYYGWWAENFSDGGQSVRPGNRGAYGGAYQYRVRAARRF